VDAVVALRSPGSTLKPLLYAQAMDQGILTPKSVLIDTPYDAEGFYAENYDGTYDGLVYADNALRRSLNVPMIRLLQKTGVGSFVDFLARAGVQSISDQRTKLGLSMIVGGCGATLEELVRAYCAFPNGGVSAPLRYLRDQRENPAERREVFSPAAAYMITEILSGLDRPDLPANIASSLNLPTIAYKTGTSYGRRDAWAIGYSAEYTIGVWIGNATNAGNPELVGSRAAAPLLVDLFNALSSPHQKDILSPPEDLGIREVCARSGLLPTGRCTKRIADYYSVSRTLNRVCDVDKEFLVSEKGDRHFCPSCLGSHRFRTETFADYPPEVAGFWKRKGVVYRTPPPHNPDCPRVFAGTGPVILSPSPQASYYLTSERQRLTLHASSGLDVHEHVWYVDREFRSRTKAGERVFIALDPGAHTLTCTDNKGRSSSVSITIRKVFE
jgi:penicillin-binding protein 1C